MNQKASRKGGLFFLLAGALWGASLPAGSASALAEPLTVLAESFAPYDWARTIAEGSDGVTVSLLTDSGVDMHSYQPGVDDLVFIDGCDMFIYNGGESDAWVSEFLSESRNESQVRLCLMELFRESVLLEEEKEGMQSVEEEEEGALDEHVWLSLKLARQAVSSIADALCELDEANASLYQENAKEYLSALSDLDASFEEMARKAPVKTAVFADRFPFLYLMKDYGLDYYAAFPGCSAETGASFETILFLTGKVEELGLHTVLVIDGSDQSIANAIIQNLGRDIGIGVMDSMQSVRQENIDSGKTYLSAMEQNARVLSGALGL